MTYLVTGGAGFIGSRIVRDLVREGSPVVAYDIQTEGNVLDMVLTAEEKAKVKVVRGDVTDLAYLFQIARENSVQQIIHMAYIMTAASRANPTLSLKVNCEGTANVFETARLLGMRKVVWASSQSVYGPPERYTGRIANDAPHYPKSIYGGSKAFNEVLAEQYRQQYGLDITATRFTVVYGPGNLRSSRTAFYKELIEKPVAGKPGRVPLGDDIVNWLYVEDAAAAALVAAKSGPTKTKAFNMTGEVRPVKEVFDYVRGLLPGADIQLLPGSAKSAYDFDTTAIEKELGFHPQWTMQRGFRELVNVARKANNLPLV